MCIAPPHFALKKDDKREVDNSNDDETEYDNMEADEDTDSDDEDDLQVDDVSGHFTHVHGFKGCVSNMNHMIKVTDQNLVNE